MTTILAAILVLGFGPSEAYPYRSIAFSSFVSDSYYQFRSAKTSDFFDSFEGAFRKQSGKSIGPYLTAANTRLRQAKGKAQKTQAEVTFAKDLHRIIKRAIPKFDLDRGFEFYNTATLGERQCFLQSVLIAGLMQKSGVNAGVAMVYRNEKGQPSNNGHAVTVVHLASGNDLVVDASEPHAFATHKGLFVGWKEGGYRYVEPKYATGPVPYIPSYNLASNHASVPANRFLTLGIPFLKSQFEYYRGERAVGGFLAKRPTPKGLKSSLRHLLFAVGICPENPLAVSVLGRVQEKLGHKTQAANSYRSALGLYAKFGWTPGGIRESLDRVLKTP